MKNARQILACLICVSILALCGPAALAATPVAPVSVPIGHASAAAAEFIGLDRRGEPDTSVRYTDITRITFGTQGVAETFEARGKLFIRGVSEGVVSFTAVSASAGELTGTMVVYAPEGDTSPAVFKRGEKSIVVPQKLELYSGQSYSFFAQSAAVAIESASASVDTRTIATLGRNRDRIIIRTSEPGFLRLFVRDNPTGDVAMCEVIVTDLQFRVEFGRDMKAPLRVGETVAAKGGFLPAITDEQLKGAEWVSFNTEVASVDPVTGKITAHSPGIAGIFLYLPLTNRYYGLGIGHYDAQRGDVVYGVLVE